MPARRQPRERELGIAENRPQDVVEVVRDAAGQPADRLHALRLLQPTLERLALARGALARQGLRAQPQVERDEIGEQQQRRAVERDAEPPSPRGRAPIVVDEQALHRAHLLRRARREHRRHWRIHRGQRGDEQLLAASRMHGDEVFDRSIDVQILRLRRKLEADPSNPALIRTERGAGYVFEASVEVS